MNENKMNYSLSDSDIRRFLPGIPILTYQELTSINDIDQILNNPYNAAVILIEVRPKSGHWTLIQKRNKMLEWFDSYGVKVDNQLQKIDKKFRQVSDQDFPYVSKLMKESPYKLSYNNHRLQIMAHNINTCGRHVICRVILKDMSLNAYNKLMRSTDLSPDELVTSLITV